jgi:hypothetical protein
MAIIKPSKKFIGSDLGSESGGKYIKPEIRQVIFNRSTNKDGLHLYFLPAYKLDLNDQGVWFKTVSVRDNFGDKFKDKYHVSDVNDPVSHFERNFKLNYPDEAVVIDEVNEKTGQTQKKYPNYGRITKRIIFNVAIVSDLEKGCHVLDLPAYNGANLLMKWQDGKDARGREKGMVNDPERAIPVFVKLNQGGGSPWQIEPDPSDPAQLPLELCDTDYIYNLDDIFIKKPNAELIDKLRSMYPPHVFEECMAGYPGFGGTGGVKAVASTNPIATTEKVSVVNMPKAAPSLKNIPKVSTASAKPQTELPIDADEDEIDLAPAGHESNPLASIDLEEAKAFLKQRNK